MAGKQRFWVGMGVACVGTACALAAASWTSATSGSEAEDLASLRAEVASLRAVLASDRAVADAPTSRERPVGEAADGGTSGRGEPRAPAERPEAASRSVEAYREQRTRPPTLGETFRAEDRDTGWAAETEGQLRQAFAEAYADIVLDRVECRAATCVVRFATSDPRGVEGLLPLVQARFGAGGAVGPGGRWEKEDGRAAYKALLKMRAAI